MQTEEILCELDLTTEWQFLLQCAFLACACVQDRGLWLDRKYMHRKKELDALRLHHGQLVCLHILLLS